MRRMRIPGLGVVLGMITTIIFAVMLLDVYPPSAYGPVSDDSYEPSGSVSGLVFDKKTGFAIEGAEVCVIAVGDDDSYTPYYRCVFTNAAGYYLIEDIPQGNYDVCASAEGCKESCSRIEINLWAEAYFALVCSKDKIKKSQLPIADAGPDQVVFDEVTLDGSESYDPDGEIVSYQWQLHHREDPAYNRTAEGINPIVSGLEPGFYDVTLTVTDNDGAIDTDTMLLAAAGECV